MELERRGVCVVVAAPSGAGKSSIVRGLLAQDASLSPSVSVTTRQRRPGEVDGRDYVFVTPERFDAMVAAGALLEHARVFGRGYGTPRGPVEERLGGGGDVVLDIDWQGWRQLRAALHGDTVGVFVLPPSLPLLEARLRRRGTDAAPEVARRMAAAREEISHWAEFDHVVVNDDLGVCIATVRSIIEAARHAVGRSTGAGALARRMVERPGGEG